MVARVRSFLNLAAFAFLGLASIAPAQPTYTNPVLDADFPDPALIKAPDGFYYAYATQTERGGKWINIQAARSADLTHWQYLGEALRGKPNWASTTQDFWAPHVVRDGRRYIMYFSAKPDTSDERHTSRLACAKHPVSRQLLLSSFASTKVASGVILGHPTDHPGHRLCMARPQD